MTTGATTVSILVASVAASAASLTYLAARIRALSKAITFWSELPSGHNALVKAVSMNTQAIAILTLRIDALTEMEEKRADGKAGM